MKKSSLLLGFGAAASLLVTPVLSGGCRTMQAAPEEHHDHGHGQCKCDRGGKDSDGKDKKCHCKMKKEGSCGEGSCGDEGGCGSKK